MLSSKEFHEIDTKFIEEQNKTMHKKGDEYTMGEDNRMFNFDVASSILTQWLRIKIAAGVDRVSPEEAAWIFALKHEVSIMQMLAEQQSVSAAVKAEKFGDKAIYNRLTYGQIVGNPTLNL